MFGGGQETQFQGFTENIVNDAAELVGIPANVSDILESATNFYAKNPF